MSERNYAIDFIRFIAILGVVLIHVSTSFTERSTPFTLDFYIIHLLNQFARFAIPLFFGISGFLLALRYSKKLNIATFYKRRVSRILLPYTSWTLIYYLVIFPSGSLLSWNFVNDYLIGTASYQLYFIPAIVVLYLLFPVIVIYRKIFLSKRFIFLLFVFQSILLYLVLFKALKIDIFPPVKHAFYNLLPYVVGIYCGANNIKVYELVKKKLLLFFLSFILLLTLIYSESIILFKLTGLYSYLREQWRIGVMLYGIATGALLYFVHEEYLQEAKKIIYHFSTFSFGIFFAHIAALSYFQMFFGKYETNGIGSLLIVFISVTILSILFSAIFSRIGIVNRILGLKG